MRDYKKILEGVANIINTTEKSDIGFDNICTYIGENCPELAEPDDERIRKELIKLLRNLFNNYSYFIKDPFYTECIAWLEKQGEQKPVDKVEPKFKVGDKIRRKTPSSFDKDMQVARIDKDYYICNHIGKFSSEVVLFSEEPYYELIEQKSVDKVEPKFKVGDWITNGHATCQITFIDSRYWYSETCVLGNVIDIDKTFHLWDITKDAKDGDVLVSKFKQPFIYNGNYDEYNVGAYCGIVYDGSVFIEANRVCRWAYNNKINPATKEQRDTLLKAMADAGYTFDFDKKELKKIEHKPAWGEEDERAIGIINVALEHPYNMEGKWDRKFALDWLKSIKGRVGCESNRIAKEWSEEDEYNFAFIQEALLGLDGDDSYREKCCKMAEWLESLKDKFVDFDKGFNVGFSAAKHNQWKPSDEQMERLKGIINSLPHQEVLYSLYQDLKKLREE